MHAWFSLQVWTKADYSVCSEGLLAQTPHPMRHPTAGARGGGDTEALSLQASQQASAPVLLLDRALPTDVSRGEFFPAGEY